MIITVHVKLHAKKETLEWVDEDTVKISVCAVAEKGKANAAVIELLAKKLGVAKSAVQIVRGLTTKIKQMEITGLHQRHP